MIQLIKEVNKRDITITHPFKKGAMSFDDYNYTLLNKFIFNKGEESDSEDSDCQEFKLDTLARYEDQQKDIEFDKFIETRLEEHGLVNLIGQEKEE